MLRFLLRTGVRRGLLGGSRAWTLVAVLAIGTRLVKKLSGSEEKVVFSEVLQPGQSFVIAHGVDAAIRPEPS